MMERLMTSQRTVVLAVLSALLGIMVLLIVSRIGGGSRSPERLTVWRKKSNSL